MEGMTVLDGPRKRRQRALLAMVASVAMPFGFAGVSFADGSDATTPVASSAAVGARAAGSVTELLVAGRGGVTADARAVELNLTVTSPAASGYVTAFPCGEPQPIASHLNFEVGQTVANVAVVPIGADGRVCLYTSAETELLADVSGFFPATSAFSPITPARLLDSRPLGQTVDGVAMGGSRVGPDSVREVPIVGRTGLNDVGAVAVNLTVTESDESGYATVFPCGTSVPATANVNFAAGETVAATVTSALGADGALCVASSVDANVIIDVNGSYPTSADFEAVAPERLLDTRASGPRAAQSVTGVRVGGDVTSQEARGRVSAAASPRTAVVMTFTVDSPKAAGFLTVYPCGSPRPNASSVNFAAGQTVTNSITTRIDASGEVCVFSSAETQLIADVTGFHRSAATFAPVVPARVMDSRAPEQTVDGLTGVLPDELPPVLEIPVVEEPVVEEPVPAPPAPKPAPSPTTGAISGTVTDDSGNPISGATVGVLPWSAVLAAAEATGLPVSTSATKTVTTDTDGNYTVNGLAAGTWVVEFTADNFAPEFSGAVRHVGTSSETSKVTVSVGGNTDVDASLDGYIEYSGVTANQLSAVLADAVDEVNGLAIWVTRGATVSATGPGSLTPTWTFDFIPGQTYLVYQDGVTSSTTVICDTSVCSD